MDQITVKAPAKLNLFLEVGERMADGYHKIESIMQSVTLYDTLIIKKADDITLSCSNKKLEYEGNLALSAAKLFFEESGIKCGASVYMEKKIPVSAGLGGGSSDAAATLKALNVIYGKPFSDEKLLEMGKKLGADVPFCIKRGLCRAYGIGEVLQPLKPLPECIFVIAKGNMSVSTKEAFASLDKQGKREIKNSDNMAEMIDKSDMAGICGSLYNVFEINGCCDNKIKQIMKDNNAYNALMSGSGPSVFGIFGSLKDAENTEATLKANGYESFVCRPENAPI